MAWHCSPSQWQKIDWLDPFSSSWLPFRNGFSINRKSFFTLKAGSVKVSRRFDMQIDLLICNNLFLSRIYQVNGNDLDKVALWMTKDDMHAVGKMHSVLFVFNDTKRIALRIKILCRYFAGNVEKWDFRSWLIVNSKKLMSEGGRRGRFESDGELQGRRLEVGWRN
jgi:hypothetical protein